MGRSADSATTAATSRSSPRPGATGKLLRSVGSRACDCIRQRRICRDLMTFSPIVSPKMQNVVADVRFLHEKRYILQFGQPPNHFKSPRPNSDAVVTVRVFQSEGGHQRNHRT